MARRYKSALGCSCWVCLWQTVVDSCCFNCHLQVKDLLDQAKKEMQAPTS